MKCNFFPLSYLTAYKFDHWTHRHVCFNNAVHIVIMHSYVIKVNLSPLKVILKYLNKKFLFDRYSETIFVYGPWKLCWLKIYDSFKNEVISMFYAKRLKLYASRDLRYF